VPADDAAGQASPKQQRDAASLYAPQARSVARRRMFEHGSMMRRLMDIAECWRVCE